MEKQTENKKAEQTIDEAFIKKLIEQTMGKEKSSEFLSSLLTSGISVGALYFLVIKPMQDEASRKDNQYKEVLSHLEKQIESLADMIDNLQDKLERLERKDLMENGYFQVSYNGKDGERIKRVKMGR